MSTTDPRQLTNDLGILLRVALQGWQAGIWTAMPAVVTLYDPATQTCECTPTIQLQKNVGGQLSWIDFPKLVDCPVLFPSGGGFTLTFPLAAGDEVLVIFASRCIDNWFATGENGQQRELRMHDPSDGFAFPSPRSLPKVPPALSTTDVQLRSNDGTTFIGISPAGQITEQAVKVVVNAEVQVNITAPVIVLNGNVTINGNAVVTGLITAEDVGLIDDALPSLASHVHLSRTDGTALTGPPITGT